MNMDKGGNEKTMYEHLQVEDTITDETIWTRMLELGMKCSSSKKGRMRGQFQ